MNFLTGSKNNEIEAFLSKVKNLTPVSSEHGLNPRLLFAMDATASRERLWDLACHFQGCMFEQATVVQKQLSVQLAYYCGFNQFYATSWKTNAVDLLNEMSNIRCLAGKTQIEKVLKRAVVEAKKAQLKAVVFVGDAIEEDQDILMQQAGRLKILNVPVFMFQEGTDKVAEHAFREIARISNGAYCAFDANSYKKFRDLLTAVAAYSCGGYSELSRIKHSFSSPVGSNLLQQLKPRKAR